MRRLILVGLGLVVAAGVVLGCGSSEDETASTPLTKAQFVKQANAICEERGKERQDKFASWEQQSSDFDAGLKKVIVPSVRQEVEELEALSPPAKDEAKVSKMIENLSEVADAIEKEGAEGISGSGLSDFERETEAYGLDVCSIT